MYINELIKTLPECGTEIGFCRRPHAFISEGNLLISGEHGDGLIDYYGEYRGGTPYIHPALLEWAEEYGGTWEWVHPGAISFCEGY